jgi:hypothetical protein
MSSLKRNTASQWVVVVLSTAVPDTSVTSFPFGSLQLLKPCLLLTSINIRLSYGVCSYETPTVRWFSSDC